MYSFRLNIVADILSRVTPAGSSLGYEINRLFRFARGSILTCNKRVPHNINDKQLTFKINEAISKIFFNISHY